MHMNSGIIDRMEKLIQLERPSVHPVTRVEVLATNGAASRAVACIDPGLFAFRKAPLMLVVFLIFTALLPSVSFAQVSAGSVGGTVRTEAGAILPGAEIAITQAKSGM